MINEFIVVFCSFLLAVASAHALTETIYEKLSPFIDKDLFHESFVERKQDTQL